MELGRTPVGKSFLSKFVGCGGHGSTSPHRAPPSRCSCSRVRQRKVPRPRAERSAQPLFHQCPRPRTIALWTVHLQPRCACNMLQEQSSPAAADEFVFMGQKARCASHPFPSMSPRPQALTILLRRSRALALHVPAGTPGRRQCGGQEIGQVDQVRVFPGFIFEPGHLRRHAVRLHRPRPRMRPAPSHRSTPPASLTHCLHTSRTDSRPRAGRSPCCLLVWRAPQVSSIILFKSSRCASRSAVTNAIESVEIDSVGIAAGRRSASLMRSSAVLFRSPARVPCIPRSLAIPRWLCASQDPGVSGSGGGVGVFV